MDISEKLRKVIAKFRISAYAIGVEFMDPDYKYNLRTLNVMISISAYMICTAYTIVTVETDIKWRALGSLGMGAQGIMKFQIAVRYCKEGFNEIRKIKELYSKLQGQGLSTDECKVLSNCCDACNKLLNAYMLIFASGFLMFLSYPIVMYVIFDQKVLMIYMVIPGMDPFGRFGFAIHYFCHTVLAFIVCAGTPAGDFYFMFCVAHIYAYVEFIRLRIERLNDCLSSPIRDREWYDRVSQQVNALVAEHQKLLEYMEQLDGYYFVTIAIQIGTATISLGIGLYLIVSSTWYLAYMHVAIGLFQLLVYSMVGTIVEVKNDHLIDYVCNIHWYLLPISEQKKILLLLAKCQNPKAYTIADQAPLNFDTCVRILKGIYSFFMMLLNTL